MPLLYNKTVVGLCFPRHEVLLNSKLNHIDLCLKSVNMKFSIQLNQSKSKQCKIFHFKCLLALSCIVQELATENISFVSM